MNNTPEIICNVFSFLDKDQIERIQLTNQFWNKVVIRHKNILPLRQFASLEFIYNQIYLYVTADFHRKISYIINFDGTNLSKMKEDVSCRYLQLTVDEVLTNLKNVVFHYIQIQHSYSENHLDYFLNMMELVTMKTEGRFRGKFGNFINGRLSSKQAEIFDNYIIVDELNLITYSSNDDIYIREVCANPEVLQLPSTSEIIRLGILKFKENDEVLNFTCNGKLNEANRLSIAIDPLNTNYGNFIRQWFKLYRKHQNPISLVGKFELISYPGFDSALGAVKTLLNNTQLRVKYSLETKEFHRFFYRVTNQYVKRSCVLHETDSYALVIEMEYGWVTDMSSINASDLDQPLRNKMYTISLCVKSL